MPIWNKRLGDRFIDNGLPAPYEPDQRIRRGTFFSVEELERAIEEYLEENNKQPKPFIWTAKVADIIKKIERARAKLEEIKSGCTQPRGKKKVT